MEKKKKTNLCIITEKKKFKINKKKILSKTETDKRKSEILISKTCNSSSLSETLALPFTSRVPV